MFNSFAIGTGFFVGQSRNSRLGALFLCISGNEVFGRHQTCGSYKIGRAHV